jgi:hypothetical protein
MPGCLNHLLIPSKHLQPQIYQNLSWTLVYVGQISYLAVLSWDSKIKDHNLKQKIRTLVQPSQFCRNSPLFLNSSPILYLHCRIIHALQCLFALPDSYKIYTNSSSLY